MEPNALAKLGQLLAEESVAHSAEFEIFKKDGSTRWILANVWPVRDGSGEVVLHEGTVEDIADRKQAEVLLREKAALQEELSTVINAVHGAIYSFLMRPDGTTAVPFASPRLYEFFETSPDAIKLDAAREFSKWSIRRSRSRARYDHALFLRVGRCGARNFALTIPRGERSGLRPVLCRRARQPETFCGTDLHST